ncbi:Dihydrolipoamide acetyltransferase component of pyruvate dehydrogenase complex (EC [Olavius algarvensis associated proteobacterium Delta 3]|nr:Dihydrolipoamide acetyltransferase component of pyruvate dehydrogenase complex (EC [Olavius algarvensis associated proteobacterium Delta 3]CAB5153626.1 Dihydrolipoamide acetyltransferase component of pyruvate dehydrogenase complex (EC [Olavius algarvensis associated proteobacterium Delta 3]
MSREFKLPDLGEGIHEGEIIAVLVAVGQDVREGEPILEIETDKAAVEIPSPFTGTVEEIRVTPGDVVNVGDVLILFSGASKFEASSEPPPATQKKTAPAPSPATAAPVTGTRTGPIPASPSTRRLARELGVELGDIAPTGPEGLVTAEDVRRSAETERAAGPGRGKEPSEWAEALATDAGTGPSLPDFSTWGPIEMTPLRSIRKTTARQMTLAWSQVPHVTSQDDVDVTDLEAFRRRQKSIVEAEGGKLTVTVFAVKAAAEALKTYPQFNVSLDTANGRIITKKYIHIGVATDTGAGLVVPVIRDADQKSISDLAVEITDLTRRTRERKVGVSELQGGTFTITNIGAAGGRGHFAPIINYPEAAILGMSGARMQPVVRKSDDGNPEMVPRLIMPVVLAIDHRVLDGTDSVKFLAFFREAMENPERFLLSIKCSC